MACTPTLSILLMTFTICVPEQLKSVLFEIGELMPVCDPKRRCVSLPWARRRRILDRLGIITTPSQATFTLAVTRHLTKTLYNNQAIRSLEADFAMHFTNSSLSTIQ